MTTEEREAAYERARDHIAAAQLEVVKLRRLEEGAPGEITRGTLQDACDLLRMAGERVTAAGVSELMTPAERNRIIAGLGSNPIPERDSGEEDGKHGMNAAR